MCLLWLEFVVHAANIAALVCTLCSAQLASHAPHALAKNANNRYKTMSTNLYGMDLLTNSEK